MTAGRLFARVWGASFYVKDVAGVRGLWPWLLSRDRIGANRFPEY